MKKIFLSLIALMIGASLSAQDPKNILKLGLGPGFTYNPDSYYYVLPHMYFRSQWGIDANLGTERMIWRFIGAGLNIDYSHTSQKEKDYKIGYDNLYVGPCLVTASRLGKYFRIDGNFGLGWSLYAEPGIRHSALGYRVSLSTEFMFSKHIGIGFEVVEHLTPFKGSDNLNRYGYAFNRVYRTSALFGIRIYR